MKNRVNFSESRTVSISTINVCVIIFPEAQVDGGKSFEYQSKIPKRVRNELAAANSIWQYYGYGRTRGITFRLIKTVFLGKNLPGIAGNAQNFPNNDVVPKILLGYGKITCPDAHVYVFYMSGNRIGPIYPDGSRTNALTFRKFPIIVMSDGAQISDYILAHELGHFLFLNNRTGNTSDPNPFSNDPDHNNSPTNLMYPRSDYWPSPPNRPTISPEQLNKALNARFFYQ